MCAAAAHNGDVNVSGRCSSNRYESRDPVSKRYRPRQCITSRPRQTALECSSGTSSSHKTLLMQEGAHHGDCSAGEVATAGTDEARHVLQVALVMHACGAATLSALPVA